MKLLVADDDAVSRRLMQRMLERMGYEVVTASDGRSALEELSRPDSPRLALIDWMMPELDGPGVCREVRSRHDERYTYILLLTSKEASEDVVAGLSAGADDYLTKPCRADELRARLLTGQRILELEDRLVEAREEMRYKATHDSLTSLWDRGAIVSLLKSEIHRSLRTGAPISIVLADVDYFKQVNDRFGHLVGDEVLREVASRLVQAVRPYDAIGLYGEAVGRYGGEEFLLILSDCDASKILPRSEMIRLSIQDEPFLVGGQALSVTMSFGTHTIDGSNIHEPVDSLLNYADAALYQSKANGRNRVTHAADRGALVGTS